MDIRWILRDCVKNTTKKLGEIIEENCYCLRNDGNMGSKMITFTFKPDYVYHHYCNDGDKKEKKNDDV